MRVSYESPTIWLVSQAFNCSEPPKPPTPSWSLHGPIVGPTSSFDGNSSIWECHSPIQNSFSKIWQHIYTHIYKYIQLITNKLVERCWKLKNYWSQGMSFWRDFQSWPPTFSASVASAPRCFRPLQRSWSAPHHGGAANLWIERFRISGWYWLILAGWLWTSKRTMMFMMLFVFGFSNATINCFFFNVLFGLDSGIVVTLLEMTQHCKKML